MKPCTPRPVTARAITLTTTLALAALLAACAAPGSDAGWTTLHHDFVVAEGGEEKEFVCELRAKSGKVWFDAATVKIVRQR